MSDTPRADAQERPVMNAKLHKMETPNPCLKNYRLLPSKVTIRFPTCIPGRDGLLWKKMAIPLDAMDRLIVEPIPMNDQASALRRRDELLAERAALHTKLAVIEGKLQMMDEFIAAY